jgi:SulP family sulfate permease
MMDNRRNNLRPPRVSGRFSQRGSCAASLQYSGAFGVRIAKPELLVLWRSEFHRYSATTARKDLVAGLTVAAVALPLALAFGVASGSTAAAGLVTAVIAGLVIGMLGGAPYQISGPTGAMSAVLIVVAHEHGQIGLWMAGLLAGLMILATGILRLGRIVSFIPDPVITGFTSGSAAVIAIGQIDNVLGIDTADHERSLAKLLGYVREPLPAINWTALICALIVMLVMIGVPMLQRRFRHDRLRLTPLPTALLGLMIVTLLSWRLEWDVDTIGAIPRSIVLADRLTFGTIDVGMIGDLLAPAFAIALLGGIESLLCGVVAGRQVDPPHKLATNQELVAQGIGNIVIPFFGGVPATAAIARTSVGVKAGGVTRLVSVIHAIALLLGMLLLAGAISRVPLAALAGVLMVTAWRMNEWKNLRFYVGHRFKSSTAIVLATMLATISLDLTQAIIIGLILSAGFFFWQVSRVAITITPIDWELFASSGFEVPDRKPQAELVEVTGSLFFASVSQLVETIERRPLPEVLIISLRRSPLVDISTIQAFIHLRSAQERRGGSMHIIGVHPGVQRMFERARVSSLIEREPPWDGIDTLLDLARRDMRSATNE